MYALNVSRRLWQAKEKLKEMEIMFHNGTSNGKQEKGYFSIS